MGRQGRYSPEVRERAEAASRTDVAPEELEEVDALIEDVRDRARKFREELDAGPFIGQELLDESMDLRLKSDMANAAWKMLGRRRVFFLVGMAMGLFLAVAGFVLWYTRLQKYQDQLILLELEAQGSLEPPMGDRRSDSSTQEAPSDS